MTQSLADNCGLCTLHKLFTTYIQIMTLHFIEITIKFKVSTICHRNKYSNGSGCFRNDQNFGLVKCFSFWTIIKNNISHTHFQDIENSQKKQVSCLNVSSWVIDSNRCCLFFHLCYWWKDISYKMYFSGWTCSSFVKGVYKYILFRHLLYWTYKH